MMDKHHPHALPPSRTSPSYSPPSRVPIFGWLLRAKSSIGSRLRPSPHRSLFMFFVIPFSCPKRWYRLPTRSTNSHQTGMKYYYWLLCRCCWIHSMIQARGRHSHHLDVSFFVFLGDSLRVYGNGNDKAARQCRIGRLDSRGAIAS